MADVHHPNDRFVKELLSHPDSARSLAREYLPADIVEQLDLSTLTPANSTWVDAELQEHFADLLFHCGWAKKLRRIQPNYQIFVALLVEHKSKPDRLIRLQLLRYQLLCWNEHLKHGRLPLPIVIPLVLYHGKTRWRGSFQFAEQFGEIPEAFRRFVPQCEFKLLDVSPSSETKIKGDPLARVSLNLLRWAHELDVDALKVELPKLLAQLPLEQATQLKFMEPIFQYLASTRMLKVQEMGEALRQAFPDEGELMKTWVDELRDEGRMAGREEGGREALAAQALRLIRRRFGEKAVTKTLAGRIDKLPLSDLEQLGEEFLDFQTVAELQRWLAGRT